MSKKQKDNSPEATLKHGSGNAVKAQESGPRATGKSVDSAISRRDDHPGKKAEKSKHEALRADQQIVADTNTVFPQHSTADKGVAAKEAQVKSNRPGISPKRSK